MFFFVMKLIMGILPYTKKRSEVKNGEKMSEFTQILFVGFPLKW